MDFSERMQITEAYRKICESYYGYDPEITISEELARRIGKELAGANGSTSQLAASFLDAESDDGEVSIPRSAIDKAIDVLDGSNIRLAYKLREECNAFYSDSSFNDYDADYYLMDLDVANRLMEALDSSDDYEKHLAEQLGKSIAQSQHTDGKALIPIDMSSSLISVFSKKNSKLAEEILDEYRKMELLKD